MPDEPTAEEMDALQGEGGPISDLCVTWADVPECDRERALEWLAKRRRVIAGNLC
jgi:hypothetical protein